MQRMNLSDDVQPTRLVAKARTYSRGKSDSIADSCAVSESEDELAVEKQITSLSSAQAARRAQSLHEALQVEAMCYQEANETQSELVYKARVEERATSVLSRLLQKD